MPGPVRGSQAPMRTTSRRPLVQSAAKSRDSALPLKRRKSGPFTGRAEPRVYPRILRDASRI
jgi:hypothetical protein